MAKQYHYVSSSYSSKFNWSCHVMSCHTMSYQVVVVVVGGSSQCRGTKRKIQDRKKDVPLFGE